MAYKTIYAVARGYPNGSVGFVAYLSETAAMQKAYEMCKKEYDKLFKDSESFKIQISHEGKEYRIKNIVDDRTYDAWSVQNIIFDENYHG